MGAVDLLVINNGGTLAVEMGMRYSERGVKGEGEGEGAVLYTN